MFLLLWLSPLTTCSLIVPAHLYKMWIAAFLHLFSQYGHGLPKMSVLSLWTTTEIPPFNFCLAFPYGFVQCTPVNCALTILDNPALPHTFAPSTRVHHHCGRQRKFLHSIYSSLSLSPWAMHTCSLCVKCNTFPPTPPRF